MTEELNTDVRKLRFLDEQGELYPEWEEKQLEEIGSWRSNHSLSKADIDPNGINKILLYGELYMKYDDTFKISKVVTKTLYDTGIPIEAGSIVMPTSGETRHQIARASAVVDYEGKIFTSGDLLVFKPCDLVQSEFLSLSMNSHKVSKTVSRMGQGFSVVHVSKSMWEKTSHSLPSLPEQEKIANLLSKIDEKIEAQAKFVELLKKQKQGYSQRLFNGSLRFKKDDGTDYEDWEEKKLGELVDYNSKIKQLSANELEEMKSDANEVKLLPSSKNYNWTTDAETAKDFITNKEVFTMGRARYANLKYVNGPFVSSNNVVLSSNNIDRALTKFLMMIVINNIEEFYVDGTTYPKFSKPNLDNFKINLPSLPEQEKIAAFLSSLDNRIDQQLNKLEQLKQEKQGYMQRVLG